MTLKYNTFVKICITIWWRLAFKHVLGTQNAILLCSVMLQKDIVVCLLHARNVEPQNQTFLSNTRTNNETAGLRNPFLGRIMSLFDHPSVRLFVPNSLTVLPLLSSEGCACNVCDLCHLPSCMLRYRVIYCRGFCGLYFQTGSNKMKLLIEYESVIRKVLFANDILAVLMS
jgi:hypothetical protein